MRYLHPRTGFSFTTWFDFSATVRKPCDTIDQFLDTAVIATPALYKNFVLFKNLINCVIYVVLFLTIYVFLMFFSFFCFLFKLKIVFRHV